MMGFAVLIGELIAYETLSPLGPSLLGFITAFSLTGASMITNDYYDRYVDTINAPNRPIPSGVISVKEALYYAALFIAIGLLSAFMTNLTCFSIAIVFLTISLVYNMKGKQMGLIGNFMVSACIAVPLLYGGFIHKDLNVNFERLSLLLFFDLMIFLSITGREVIKGIVDVEGDRVRNVQTIAIRFSPRTATIIGIFFFLSSVGLSVIPWLNKTVTWLYLPFIVISDLGFITSSIILWKDYSKENAKRVKNMILLWMIMALLAFTTEGLVKMLT